MVRYKNQKISQRIQRLVRLKNIYIKKLLDWFRHFDKVGESDCKGLNFEKGGRYNKQKEGWSGVTGTNRATIFSFCST